MNNNKYIISGKDKGIRIESRVLEEQIQAAVAAGHTRLVVEAYGQHGIGGRLWSVGDQPVHMQITGPAGQRIGAMGFSNTHIEVLGPCSDDVGWLNAGAVIVVHGHAGNGAANAMAQGKVYVAGNIGARGMTMTKQNPRFAPPELWVLGSAGDYFGEFMAGGIAVICGHKPQNRANVLGYRPLVGMVGGKVFFRGPHRGFSQTDAILVPIDDAQWEWLLDGIKQYVRAIGQETHLLPLLTQREEWQCLRARTPQERISRPKRAMADFRHEVWEQVLGKGGLVGDLTDLDRGVIPLITRGDLRRYVPVWENEQYAAPCEAGCPTGIPVQARWRMVREGRVDEAVDMALAYTPFPATVCGYLCPNLCMQSCTKQSAFMAPVDVTQLGKASVAAKRPELPPLSGRKIAVIGGGPAGISTAWQLRLQGHEAIVHDTAPKLGGKIAAAIPASRIPAEVFDAEIERVRGVIPHVHLQQRLTRADVDQLIADHDFVVVAAGAQKPRTLPIPGKELLVTALDFLAAAKAGTATVGERVVIIGAGNVGCDVAAEAARLGARQITLLDLQKPASFGKEREEAEKAGARFRWPVLTKAITAQGVELDDGETIPADSVFVSIGDVPDLDFLPTDVALERGYIKVDQRFQTSNPKVFAIGDAVRPGLLTDAIGAGRTAARTIDAILGGKRPPADKRALIDIDRVHLEYFDPRMVHYEDMQQCGTECASCGQCRDCGICVAACPESAIQRTESAEGRFEYVVDPQRCIGCGFCAGVCPCGIWNLVENGPLDREGADRNWGG
ncbi:FAD-dependent oxidoreductase [Desulfatitalea alkaliphila]|uniref:FAD-dependent oxidoreductase n=1 Tax=Desulfatitalea alkaliphila TaxID=2929485 RepID=A0AA41R0N4_9BACT|nr:FAD-dependent oxidoreductase [Desulfatitalea alkaliphila]MCJ8499060.1 FAD-dependent oxidoreductase [Desulfatitalea alkaliphila]